MLVLCIAITVALAGAGAWYVTTRPPTRGNVRVFDSATGHHL
jgi:hypothetical protein